MQIFMELTLAMIGYLSDRSGAIGGCNLNSANVACRKISGANVTERILALRF